MDYETKTMDLFGSSKDNALTYDEAFKRVFKRKEI